MAYADQAALAVSDTFRARVQLATVRAARTVRVTPWDEGTESSTVYKQKQALALKILNDPSLMVPTVAWALASDSAISLATSDNDLQSAVNDILINLSRG